MFPVRVALAQINPTVGALAENRRMIEARLEEARGFGARAVLLPELALTGYPPEDLLKNAGFLAETRAELERLLPASRSLLVAVGAPLVLDGHLRNAAALLQDGRWVDTYAKGTLPNYGVFDEKRYFRPGLRCPVYGWGEAPFGLHICEDLWVADGVPGVQARAGARWLWNLSSSPYHAGKGSAREALLRHRARRHGAAIAYCNLVGGQDELVFDGESLFVDAAGTVRARGPQFREALLIVDVEEGWLGRGAGGSAPDAPEAPDTRDVSNAPDHPDAPDAPDGPDAPDAPDAPSTPDAREVSRARSATGSAADPLPAFIEPAAEPIDELEGQFRLERVRLESAEPAAGRPTPASAPAGTQVGSASARLGPEAEIYAALKLGVSDYVRKNRFQRVALGLSGGIDSALTAAIAADALGAGAVTGVSMPSRFNSAETRQDARDVAARLGIAFHEIPIETAFTAFLQTLRPLFGDAPADVTEENIQARVRAVILMAISNRTGALILTAGNKSELAVGYCTLYGDMAGGLAVIKDVPKTLVYRLARWRNSLAPVIPEATIARAPSAELRPGQKDADTLPPYDLLDAIVQARMEAEEDPQALVARGLDARWVETVYRWIDGNEYKRRQAPPGIRITPRAFGRDRRYPITNRYRWKV